MIFERQLLWDETKPLLKLLGNGSRAFLNGQTTADFSEVKQGSFVRGCWLNTLGRVRALFEARLIAEGAELLVLGGDFDEVKKGFDQVLFPADNVLIDSSQKIRRVQNLEKQQPERFDQVAWLLPEQSLPKALEGSESLSPLNFDRWRMEHGLPIGPGELNARNNPFELGLSNLVNLNKGCYLGQETIAKLARAGQAKKQLRFWESDKTLSTGQTLTNSLPNSIEKKNIGVVISSIKDTKLDSSFGLAILRSQAFEDNELYLTDDLIRVHIKVPIGFVGPSSSNLGLV